MTEADIQTILAICAQLEEGGVPPEALQGVRDWALTEQPGAPA